MTPELFWLSLSAVLLASLWIPFVIGINIAPGHSADFTRAPDMAALPRWTQRAFRAHLNLLEQFAPFAVLVLIGHSLGVSTAVTAGAAAAFFWLRVAHAVIHITAIGANPLRPIVFTAGWVAVLAVAVELFRTA